MASDPFFEARRGTWKLKYRPDPLGKWVTVTLCKHHGAWAPSKPPKKPPQEAIDRARDFAEIEYRAKHGLGSSPARAKGLAAYLDGYVTSQALSTRSGSAEQLARHVRTFKAFAEARGIASIQAVTRAHCREYLEGRIKVVARSTLQTERGYLVGAWTRAVDDGLMAANPWSGVSLPGKIVPTSITFWSGEEIAKIAAACNKSWHADLVLILANTALRISTALAMEWSWVDWQEGTIKVPAGVEEVKTSYALSIGRVARDVLTRRLATSDGSPLVFPNPLGDHGVVGYDTARAAIERAIGRAKVKHGTCHDLRHSCARNMILAGIPITVVQRQLGHTTLAMTMKYVTADAESSAKYMEDFGIGDGSGE
jgi:integrase